MKKTLFIGALASVFSLQAQNIKDSSILVSAESHPSLKQITINWKTTDAGSFQISRKTPYTKFWGTPIIVPGNVNSYVDTSIKIGEIYEYRIAKLKGNTSFRAFSYVAAGKDIPLQDYKNNILLLVDSNSYNAIDSNVWQNLKNDYYMDGFGVQLMLVSENALVPDVKSKIQAWYNQSTNLNKYCLLIGRIPVAYAGTMLELTFDTPPDGHKDHGGAWPTDNYYAEMDGTWTDNASMITNVTRDWNKNLPGDGKFDQHFLPDDIDIQMGRLDFRNLPAQNKTDIQLLQQYLIKLHNYKTGMTKAPNKAFISDNFGYLGGEMPMRSGWNSASAIVGENNITRTGNYFDSAKVNTYLWADYMGAGSFTNCSGVGNSAAFKDSILSVFNVSFGSYFGDWFTTDNFLRSSLATKGLTLTNLWGHRPHWYFHQMALGMPIGHSVVTSQNNLTDFSLASNYIGSFSGSYLDRRISMNLMGDPTLRLSYLLMPKNLLVTPANNNTEVTLTWTASQESDITSYNIYRTNKKMDIYYLIGSVSSGVLTYSDVNPYSGDNFYIVKAVKKETSNCGTYMNSSLGISGQISGINGNNTSINNNFTNNITVYPNPSSQFFMIQSEAGVSVKVMDIQGRVIENLLTDDNLKIVQTENWSKGVYILVFTKGSEQHTEKLIIQ